MSNSTEQRAYFLVRKDLEMTGGKIAAQVAHASMELSKSLGRDYTYLDCSKIVLYVDNLEELVRYHNLCVNLPTAIVVDGGRTQVDPDTITVMGIGPLEQEHWSAFKALELVG